MDDAVLDEVFQSAGHLLDDLDDLPLVDPVDSDKLVEVHLAALHHDIKMAVFLEAILKLDDVGVVEALEDRYFLFEADLGESSHFAGLYFFDREGRRGEDRPEGALSQFFMKGVLSQSVLAADCPWVVSHRFSKMYTFIIMKPRKHIYQPYHITALVYYPILRKITTTVMLGISI